MATYSVKLTCSLAGFLQLTLSFSSSLAEACRLKEVSDMACPFLEEPVDIEAQILSRNLRRERVIRPRMDVLSFPDDHLFERYRFSAQSIIHLNNILSPHIVHMTIMDMLSVRNKFFVLHFVFLPTGVFYITSVTLSIFPRQPSVGLSEM